jgi:hypothetical protein
MLLHPNSLVYEPRIFTMTSGCAYVNKLQLELARLRARMANPGIFISTDYIFDPAEANHTTTRELPS